MKKVLPERASLENLRKQAKTLLTAMRAGEHSAMERLKAHHPGVRGELGLHDAQLVLAREYGFEHWGALKEQVEFLAADRDERIRLLVEGARKIPRDRVLSLLAHDPNLVQEPALAAVIGDVPRLTAALDDDPSLVNRPTRFEGWTLLMIAAGSPLLGDPERRAQVLAVLRLLLARGADPNGYVPNEEYPDSHLGALYAAANMSRDLEVVRLLLDAGATADDGESLYHATEGDDLRIAEVLIQAGASLDGGVLHNALYRESPAMLRLLLQHGADPETAKSYFDPNPALHHAVRNGRSAETIGLLLDHGADPARRDDDGRTAYSVAIRCGRPDLLAAFEERGYREEINDLERSLLEGNLPSGELPEEVTRHLPDAARGGNLSHVQRLLASGWPVNAQGDEGATAIHWASWFGNLAMVQSILAYGPDLTIRDTSFDAPPLGWAHHGSMYSPAPKDDYPAVIEALVVAGAPMILKPDHEDERINDVIRRLIGD